MRGCCVVLAWLAFLVVVTVVLSPVFIRRYLVVVIKISFVGCWTLGVVVSLSFVV